MLEASIFCTSPTSRIAHKHADINAPITWLDIPKAHSTAALSTPFNRQ